MEIPPSPPKPSSSTTVSQLMYVSNYGKLVVNRSDLPLPLPEEEIRKSYKKSLNWGWLQPDFETLSIYTQLPSIIQHGPQCGLVALSMSTHICQKSICVEDLLQEALNQRFTKHGEMFSADDMAHLANSIESVTAMVREDVLCNTKKFLELILHGDLILVPYDTEHNHMPGLKKGQKAHWGVISGCIVQPFKSTNKISINFRHDSQIDNLWQYLPKCAEINREFNSSLKIDLSLLNNCSSNCTKSADTKSTERVSASLIDDLIQEDLVVIAMWRHGKSKNLAASPLQMLCESNNQLASYQPTCDIEKEYVIKHAKNGLSGQTVVLHRL